VLKYIACETTSTNVAVVDGMNEGMEFSSMVGWIILGPWFESRECEQVVHPSVLMNSHVGGYVIFPICVRIYVTKSKSSLYSNLFEV
jgi:hypothetical protein